MDKLQNILHRNGYKPTVDANGKVIIHFGTEKVKANLFASKIGSIALFKDINFRVQGNLGSYCVIATPLI